MQRGAGANIRLPPPPSAAGGASRERMLGTLEVLCERAAGLPNRPDAFVRVRIGSEDRRTKMWFINLNRLLMVRIILVIVGQFLAATGAGIIKWLYAAD